MTPLIRIFEQAINKRRSPRSWSDWCCSSSAWTPCPYNRKRRPVLVEQFALDGTIVERQWRKFSFRAFCEMHYTRSDSTLALSTRCYGLCIVVYGDRALCLRRSGQGTATRERRGISMNIGGEANLYPPSSPEPRTFFASVLLWAFIRISAFVCDISHVFNRNESKAIPEQFQLNDATKNL